MSIQSHSEWTSAAAEKLSRDFSVHKTPSLVIKLFCTKFYFEKLFCNTNWYLNQLYRKQQNEYFTTLFLRLSQTTVGYKGYSVRSSHKSSPFPRHSKVKHIDPSANWGIKNSIGRVQRSRGAYKYQSFICAKVVIFFHLGCGLRTLVL